MGINEEMDIDSNSLEEMKTIALEIEDTTGGYDDLV